MFRWPMLAALIPLVAAPAFAQPPGHDPDWPCIQRKVPELQPAAVWSGPAIEDVLATWDQDPEVRDLVDELASRRIPLQDAQERVTQFAQSLDEAGREARLTAVFAGLFRTLDTERKQVIAGIERYGRKQKDLADAIRRETVALETLEAKPDADRQAIAEKADQIMWSTRIFDERRASLSFVCEVPTLIEQRFFTLARALQAGLSG